MPISTIGSNSLNQTSDLTINGQTVGKGGGNVATNTAHGVSALNGNSSGTGVTAIGSSALPVSTASNNTAVGRVSGNSTTSGSDNTFMGMQSGYSNVTGSSNVYVGVSAGYSATGSSNTLIGQGSGELISSGAKNTILGRYNGNQGGLDIRTASNYIVLSDGDGNPRGWFDNNGTFILPKTAQFTATPPSLTIDSSYQLVTLTANSSVTWSAFSGMLIVTETIVTGQTAILICGGGVTVVASQTESFYTTSNIAGKYRWFNNAGSYSLQNLTTGTCIFGICAIRSRSNS